MKIYQAIESLVRYGLRENLIQEDDSIYVRNQILEACHLSEYEENEGLATENLEEILLPLIDLAVEKGIIEDNSIERDIFDTKLMNILVARPSEVLREYKKLYEDSPIKATEYYYHLSKASNYIRTARVAKDKKWKVNTEFGELDITINLSKPEKDPKAIAAEKLAVSSSYPKCLLCKENMGYAGRINHPARHNHRLIPLTIDHKLWYMQYSPYVYYNEHCIVFCGEHLPMKIERATFCKLFDFIKAYPHYMLGSNADLPIVGGSILSHDHFQGGNYEFTMARAKSEIEFSFKGFEDVKASILYWPMSVIRISAADANRLIDLADIILQTWRGYTDTEAYIYAHTTEDHNTITPIARKRGDVFELDLVLRNNITTEDRPDGLYHPNPSLHHIKKENIGLIEVMGLAILPSRLDKEMQIVKEYILYGKKEDESLNKHLPWADVIKEKYTDIHINTVDTILQQEIGLVFKEVLEDAGVYKVNKQGREAFMRFIDAVNRR